MKEKRYRNVSEEEKQKLVERGKNVVKKTAQAKDEKLVKGKKIADKMFEVSQKDLIPRMQAKVKEVAQKIDELIGKDTGLLAPQIEKVIGNRSLEEIATVRTKKRFTPEEILIGLELYKELIAKINEKTPYPPSVFSFCSFIGLSYATYQTYRIDPNMSEAMQMVDDYISGIQFTSAQTGKIKEVMTIFGLKSMHGFVEAQAPVVVKHEKEIDIDEIREQVNALKNSNAIDVEFEEKD